MSIVDRVFKPEIERTYNGRFKITRVLAFAEDVSQYVFVCDDTTKHTECVVKCTNKSDPKTFEYSLLKNLPTHSNIVKLYATMNENIRDTYEYLFLEKMDMSLDKYLRTSYQPAYMMGPEVNTLIGTIMDQILAGVAHLHSKNWAHMDLKPENILVNRDEHVIKLTDFGLSMPFFRKGTAEKPFLVHDEYDPDEPVVYVTAMYRPIELTAYYVAQATKFDPKRGLVFDPTAVDVWSIGVILYQIMFAFSLGNAKFPVWDADAFLYQRHTSDIGYWPFYDYRSRHQHDIANFTKLLGPIAEQPSPWIEQEPNHASAQVVAINSAKVRSTLQAASNTYFNPAFFEVMLQMFIYNPAARITVAAAQNHIRNIIKEYGKK